MVLDRSWDSFACTQGWLDTWILGESEVGVIVGKTRPQQWLIESRTVWGRMRGIQVGAREVQCKWSMASIVDNGRFLTSMTRVIDDHADRASREE